MSRAIHVAMSRTIHVAMTRTIRPRIHCTHRVSFLTVSDPPSHLLYSSLSCGAARASQDGLRAGLDAVDVAAGPSQSRAAGLLASLQAVASGKQEVVNVDELRGHVAAVVAEQQTMARMAREAVQQASQGLRAAKAV